MCGLRRTAEGTSSRGVPSTNPEALNPAPRTDPACGNADHLVRCPDDVTVRYLMLWERWRGEKSVLATNPPCRGFAGRGGGTVVHVIDDLDAQSIEAVINYGSLSHSLLGR